MSFVLIGLRVSKATGMNACELVRVNAGTSFPSTCRALCCSCGNSMMWSPRMTLPAWLWWLHPVSCIGLLSIMASGSVLSVMSFVCMPVHVCLLDWLEHHMDTGAVHTAWNRDTDQCAILPDSIVIQSQTAGGNWQGMKPGAAVWTWLSQPSCLLSSFC